MYRVADICTGNYGNSKFNEDQLHISSSNISFANESSVTEFKKSGVTSPTSTTGFATTSYIFYGQNIINS